MALTVDKYPRWYTPVKWLLPISLAMLAATIVATAILGILPIPFAFGKLAWLPAIYASLETGKAAALLIGATASVASIVGFMTSFIARSTILFHVNETIGTQGQKAQEQIDELNKVIQFQEEQRNLMREKSAHDNALHETHPRGRRPIIPSLSPDDTKDKKSKKNDIEVLSGSLSSSSSEAEPVVEAPVAKRPGRRRAKQ